MGQEGGRGKASGSVQVTDSERGVGVSEGARAEGSDSDSDVRCQGSRLVPLGAP